MGTQLLLSKIRIDGGTQPRATIDESAVAEYGEVLSELPPIDVFFDGADYWLADGFHRYHAFRQAKSTSIMATVHKGTCRDAILFSVQANTGHGLRRSNADKRKAVETLLNDKEWGQWNDGRIAQQCGVSRKFVQEHRAHLVTRLQDGPTNDYDTRKVERGGKAFDMKVGAIGKPAKDPDVFHNDPPAPKPDPIAKDEEGNVIKRADIRKIFDRRAELESLARDVSRIKTTILNGLKDEDPLYYFLDPTRIKADLENVYRAIEFAMPYGLCPYHASDKLACEGCRVCGGHGWLGKDQHKLGKAAMRKGA